MKKILALLLTTGIVFNLTSSQAQDLPPPQELKEIKIVTSFYPMYIMALNVTKNVPGITLANLASPAIGCLHDYALTTDDMKKIADADILIVNGAGMESFLSRALQQYPNLKVITLSDGISLIKNKDFSENPHVWVSVSAAMEEVKNLARGLQELDSAHKDIYHKNAYNYLVKLEALQMRMKEELKGYQGRRIITSHEAFPYLAQEFGLEIASVIEREPGSTLSAQELAQTIDLIKRTGIKTIFSEPQYPDASAQTIAKETGSKVYVLDPAVTGPDDPDAYLNIMEKNLETLKEALK